MRFKKKKVKKYRGSKTHGCGSMKKRRGAGNRGGRGRAGSGKRGDAKKPLYWKVKSGKKGFTSKNRKKIKALNLGAIHENLNAWLEKGLAIKKPAGYEIELKKLGYNKLLGTGAVKEKLIIITDFASKKAVGKVKKAGGDVRVLQKTQEKVQKVQKKQKAQGEQEPKEQSQSQEPKEDKPKHEDKAKENKKQIIKK